DGAFLSRFEDTGGVVEMESSVNETRETLREVVQYIKQQIIDVEEGLKKSWGEIYEKEGYRGIKKRWEKILGYPLSEDFELRAREFTKGAVKEIVRELRIRTDNRRLSAILRPINGIIREAEFKAINSGSAYVEAHHVREAIKEHTKLDGFIRDLNIKMKRELKKYLEENTTSIGYVVGLAVFESPTTGQRYGTPMPIRCQIDATGYDRIVATGKIGTIAKEAAENVKASIRRSFKKADCIYIGYEMHIEYIQSYGDVEGDSASLSMAVGLISDYIGVGINQKYGVTGSIAGDVILSVGGVAEKVRSVMDIELGMDGVCIPWQNRMDIEPLLINAEAEYIQRAHIPGIRIYRGEYGLYPFDIFFCKTTYDALEILMGLKKEEIEERMLKRSR
ncbi:MAG: hypothetical protein D6828_04705, partial [Nitrospirae bacterium]